MMPACEGGFDDPPAAPLCWSAGLLPQLHPQFCKTAKENSTSDSWRLRIIATLISIFTLLAAFSTILEYSALGADASPVVRGDIESASYLHIDNPNKSEETELWKPVLRPSAMHEISVQSAFPKVDMKNPVTHQMEKPPWSSPMTRHSARSSQNRILVSSACTNKDISIFQSADGSSGIPRYAVQIMNNCMSDCPPSDIHVFCGWFASALLVNPNSFKRVAFNDCVVNGGKPLRHGETLRFTYANSFMYPLRFKSASFCK